jgi:hypothetical protein
MPDEVFIIVMASLVSVTLLGFGVLRTISSHLARKLKAQQGGEGSEQVLAELEEIRSRLEGSEELRDRMGDMEERLEFTERMLTESKRRDQLRAES